MFKTSPVPALFSSNKIRSSEIYYFWNFVIARYRSSGSKPEKVGTR